MDDTKDTRARPEWHVPQEKTPPGAPWAGLVARVADVQEARDYEEVESVVDLPTDPVEVFRESQQYGAMITREMQRRQIQRDVVALEARRAADDTAWPDFRSLEGWLDDPPAKPEPLIEGMHTRDGNTTIAAKAKTGKTTLLLNRVRSMLEGSPFLGAFETQRVDGVVTILNWEVSGGMFVDWIRDAGIKRTGDVYLVNLRGHPLDIMNDVHAEWLVDRLRRTGTEVLELDPFSAAFRGNANIEAEVSPWLRRLDEIKADAGVRELFLTTHTGHGNERTAGSHRLLGWPDNLWTYVSKDETSKRMLRCVGRDTYLEEGSLSYEPAGRVLTWDGKGTGRSGPDFVGLAALLNAAGADGVPTSTFSGKGNERLLAARKALEVDGRIEKITLPKADPSKRGQAPTAWRWPASKKWVQD